MMWSVWAEGYRATGEYGTAMFLGRAWADTFEGACETIHRLKGGTKNLGQFTRDPPSFWGCRLFNNEADAKRAYG